MYGLKWISLAILLAVFSEMQAFSLFRPLNYTAHNNVTRYYKPVKRIYKAPVKYNKYDECEEDEGGYSNSHEQNSYDNDEEPVNIDLNVQLSQTMINDDAGNTLKTEAVPVVSETYYSDEHMGSDYMEPYDHVSETETTTEPEYSSHGDAKPKRRKNRNRDDQGQDYERNRYHRETANPVY